MNNETINDNKAKVIEVTSNVFNNGGHIPSKYTSDGENINPPLKINGLPEETKCLAIIVEDPDTPIRPWIHWLAWNISASQHIKEGRVMEVEGRNDFGENKYSGPCHIAGIHRYYFKTYALNAPLNLPINVSQMELEKAMRPHIIGFGEITATYKRK